MSSGVMASLPVVSIDREGEDPVVAEVGDPEVTGMDEHRGRFG